MDCNQIFQTHQQACTTVEEISGKEDMGDISNLTAEIETFVRAHDNDQEKLRESPEKSPLKKKEKSPPIPPARSTSNTTTVIDETSDDGGVVYSQTTVTIEQVPIQTVNGDVRNHSVEVHQQLETKISETDKTVLDDTEQRQLVDRKFSRESPENNEDYPERTSQAPESEQAKIRKFNSEKQLNVNDNVEPQVEVALQSPPRIIVRKPTEDWEYDEEIRLNDDGDDRANGEESPKTPISSEVEFILEHDDSARTSQTQNIQKRESETIVVETVHVASTSLNDDSPEKPKVSTKKNFENSLENSFAKNHELIAEESTPEATVPELKIVESTDDLTSAPTTVSQSSDKYKIRFVALKNFSPEPQRRDVELRPHNNQEFDVEDVDLPPAPPQRRRSVKDIIASINKSQSLLKMNQQPNGNADAKRSYSYETYLPQTIPNTAIKEPSQPKQSSNESIIRKYSELEESERKIRKMITDMEQSTIDVPVPVVEKFDEFTVDSDESSDLFKKCVVRRVKSGQPSGASHEESRSSMEWNPLPKPRRSRNLTHELENGKI